MISKISFYTDTLIIEALYQNKMIKQADGLANSLLEAVKNYANNHIDPNDKINSVLKILAPAGISMIFGALGFPWLGGFLGLAISVFHIDVPSILRGIYSQLSGEIQTGNKLTSNQVNNIVHSNVQDYLSLSSDDEVKSSLDQLKQSFKQDIRIVKLAMISTASITDLFNKQKVASGNVFSKILSWIINIVLAAAGFLVVGDVVNKFLGRPNAFDNTLHNGKEEETIPTHTSSQTKFKVNPNYHDDHLNNWSENISNNKSSINQLLLNIAKEVYPDLNNLDEIIESAPEFQALLDQIVFYNHTSQGDHQVWIPKEYTSKKQLVDTFIDQVAQNSK